MGKIEDSLVSANQVTLARLFAMPLYAWLLYQTPEVTGSTKMWWIATFAAMIIASTDFVDGYLARRHGPTILGGLLDPMADKVFVALSFIPLADIYYNGATILPWWMVGLILFREYVVTALRTSYEIRNLTLKTSYFGKVKTWVQMQFLAALLMILLVQKADWLMLVCWGMVILSTGFFVKALVKKQKVWRGAYFLFGGLAVQAAAYQFLSVDQFVQLFMWTTVGITLASGADYGIDAAKHLRGKGMLSPGELIRLISAVLVPWLCMWVVYKTSYAWAPMAIISIELAVGGLDNLLANDRKHARALQWGLRMGGITAGLIVALISTNTNLQLAGCVFAIVASAVGVGWEFYRGRDYYLESSHRNRKL